MTAPAESTSVVAPGRRMWPLYAAGFTTAFGAHAVAANLGGLSADAVKSLLTLGMLLALYDGAEVLLKSVFGTVADRIGARPVPIAGLAGFALASRCTWSPIAPVGSGPRVSDRGRRRRPSRRRPLPWWPG